MFHHFHGNGHPIVQGSISGDEMADMIEFLGGRRNILPADEWVEKAVKGKLKRDDLCLTFDDGILGQKDVAIPVLDSFGITAIFCVYSSVFSGGLETLEIFRAFRTKNFPNLQDFYTEFFESVAKSEYEGKYWSELADFNPENYLIEFPFYTELDKKFRYVRDKILGSHAYNQIMIEMIEETTSIEELSSDLWMTNEDLVQFAQAGHILGLHSNSHPAVLNDLTAEEQLKEYKKNKTHLTKLLGSPPCVVAHPCNSYDGRTIAILKNLGVQIGFRANMSIVGRGGLEFAREDHANILNMMKRP